MKNSKWLLLAGMVVMLMTIGCQKQMGFVDSPPGDDIGIAATSTLPIQYNPGGSWFTYFMWTPPGPTAYALSIGNDAGGNGTVTVEKVGANLIVTYQTFGDWYIQMTHFDVALTKAGLAHNKSGNLVPGKFRFQGQSQSIPYPQLVTMTVAWKDSWNTPPPEGLYMAALANVCEGVLTDTGWYYWNFNTGAAGDTEPPPPPPPPGKRVSLPSYQIELLRVNQPFAIPDAPDSNTYWQIGLRGIVEDSGTFNVWNGTNWKGWCLEGEIGLGYDWIPVTLVSTQDLTPSSPPRLWKNGQWHQVNWLINHKSLFPKPSLGGPYGWWLYQDVIHCLVGELPVPPTDFWERTMYDSAMAHPDYEVPPGGWVGVLAITPINQQLVLLEVDP